jgi:hypothetical protein
MRINGMQSDVEGLCSNFCSTVWHQPFQAQRTRRRPSTPLMPGPLGGGRCSTAERSGYHRGTADLDVGGQCNRGASALLGVTR